MLKLKSVCFVVSDIVTAKAFLRNHLATLAAEWKVSVVFNPRTARGAQLAIPGVEELPVAIERRVRPVSDLLALAALVRLFRRLRFAAIHSVTPKAGLLSALAGCIANVPVRLHTFTGQVWATKSGPARWLLKRCDWLTALLDTHLLADSRSQLEFLVQEGVVNPEKISVLADGSISGVDTSRFKPNGAARSEVRNDLAIPQNAFVYLFMGRLNPDKGLLTLAEAFVAIARLYPHAYLLVVGRDEAQMRQRIERAIGRWIERVRFLPHTEAPEEFMAASDVLCLPSRREGFGSTIIEAAATGIPAVASRIYGLTDAVINDVTGLLHRPDDSADLAAKMRTLLESPATAAKMGLAARERALRCFSCQRVTGALAAYYRGLLNGTEFQPEKPSEAK